MLAGCAPLLVGTAVVGTGLVVSDRRTTGTQLEDQSIELKAASRIRDAATLGRVSATSYNRIVLLTGEVPGEAEKAAAERAVRAVENVQGVVNELAVMPNTTLGQRSNDTVLGTKVKASFVDTKDLQANAFKVVADRGIVYLMGRVTEREAHRATEIARSVAGVQKVVRVLEIISEDELQRIARGAPPVAQGASAPR
ncbi:MAG: BON domain-containing protein [Rubrivivax sp.]|nr:BON domain-containing protein [Rubrivivax sp.]